MIKPADRLKRKLTGAVKWHISAGRREQEAEDEVCNTESYGGGSTCRLAMCGKHRKMISCTDWRMRYGYRSCS